MNELIHMGWGTLGLIISICLFFWAVWFIYQKPDWAKKPFVVHRHEMEAIDFAEWITENDWIRSSNNLWYYRSDGNPNAGITTTQLYKKFKDEI